MLADARKTRDYRSGFYFIARIVYEIPILIVLCLQDRKLYVAKYKPTVFERSVDIRLQWKQHPRELVI